MARDVSTARFRPVTCRALCWIGAASGRRKSEEPPLLPPIVGQVPGEHDEPCGRQLDGLLAGQDRANDFRREIRETHEHRHIIAPHAKPRRHGVDAVITARKEHVAGCDRSGDQGGKAVIDRFRGAIADHQPHTLSSAAKACGDRQDERFDSEHAFCWLGRRVGHDARHDGGSMEPHQDLGLANLDLLDQGSHEFAKLA
jgi:hypothetical protein